MIKPFKIPPLSSDTTAFSSTDFSYKKLKAETEIYFTDRDYPIKIEREIVESLASKAFYAAEKIHLTPYKCFVAGLKKVNVAYKTKISTGILWDTKQQLERKLAYLAKKSRLPQDQIDRVIIDAVASCERSFDAHEKQGWALSKGLEYGTDTFHRYIKAMNDRDDPNVA